MKPPSSDANAFRHQETPQVRASNGLLMAPDVVGDLKRRHQAMSPPVVKGRLRFCVGRSIHSIRVLVLSHDFLRQLWRRTTLDAECL